ncbi:Triosephosphate isomerase, partial [hydrothermal vent metagenome]
MRRKLAAGNWKMNGTSAALSELKTLINAHPSANVDILICPPATLISQAAKIASNSSLTIGGQDCHNANSGAHTGDISAAMLVDAGATSVILGHSERRENHNESNGLIHGKACTAHKSGLITIICLGESLAQREAGKTLEIIADQLANSVPETASAANTVIAYEPIWAIGTGLTPTTGQIAEVHDFIRTNLQPRFGDKTATGLRLLYGGSVKPGN